MYFRYEQKLAAFEARDASHFISTCTFLVLPWRLLPSPSWSWGVLGHNP